MSRLRLSRIFFDQNSLRVFGFVACLHLACRFPSRVPVFELLLRRSA
jgi:hypothetical protein